MMEKPKSYSWLFYLGLSMVFIYAILVFSSIGFLLFRFKISVYTTPFSFILFLIINPFFLRWYGGFQLNKSVVISLISLVLFSACLWCSTFIHETLFDAIWYHHDAVYNLAAGWNPFERYLLPDETAYCHYYLNHFPIGNWAYGASIYLFTHTIEAAKGITVILILSSIFILCGGLIQNHSNWSKFRSIITGLLISLNPIALLNIFSFYVDGPLAIILTLGLTFAAVQLWSKDSKAWLPAMICFAILTHLKLTGTAYSALFMMIFAILVYLRFKSDYKIWLIRFSIFTILVVIIFGYHPFVSNTIDKGHPFFPANDNKEVNVFDEKNYPANFYGLNRFEKFAIALYSESGWVRTPDNTVLKKPFTFNGLGNYGNGIPDIGAFGPIFQEAFTLALLIFIISLFIAENKIEKKYISILTLVFVFSFFINREAYIFRYIPHLWILTILFASALWDVKGWRNLTFLCLTALLFNVYRMEVKVVSSMFEKNEKINSCLNEIRGKEAMYAIDFGWAKSFKMRLGENGIDTSSLQWISPTDTPFTEIPGSLGGKFKLRNTLQAH